MSIRRLLRLRRKGVMIALPFAAAVLPLAFAQTAAADTVYTPTTAAQLTQDISQANSTGGFNIIELAQGNGFAPTTPITVTGHLEITGAPKVNATIGHTFTIGGAAVQPLNTSDTITVASGANLILKGFDLQQCASNADPSVTVGCVRVLNGGNVELDNMAIVNPVGEGLIVNPGGHATLNNAEIIQGNADGINVETPSGTTVGTITLNNSDVAQNQHSGILWATGDHVTLNNSILAQNNQAAGTPGLYQDCKANGTAGPVTGAAAATQITSMDDDGTCGVTFSNDTYVNFGSNNFGQGPSTFLVPGQGDSSGLSDAQGVGTVATCQNDDQRFYQMTTGFTSCDLGAYQSGATAPTNTTGPVCTAHTPNYSTNPATMQVDVTSSSTGVGPDVAFNPIAVLKSTAGTAATTSAAVTNASTITSIPVNPLANAIPAGSIQISSGFNTQTLTTTGAAAGSTSIPITGSPVASTTFPTGSSITDGTVNGTVGWPVISGTLFDETNPMGAGSPPATGADGNPILLDEPSTSAFPVTAQKPLNDGTVGDTYWQFDASDWLGNTTLCK